MIVIGRTSDGCLITRHVGGLISTETTHDRDERLAAEAVKRVEAAAPDLLRAARIAYRVLATHRLSGFDQNPMAVHDVLFSAIHKADPDWAGLKEIVDKTSTFHGE